MDGYTIDWDALATFVTGLLAVGAAFFVGRRQADIMARQVRVEEAGHAAALFEQRFEVFLATENYLQEYLVSDQRPTRETEGAFIKARTKSELLFAAPVADRLGELHQKVERAIAVEALLNRAIERGDVTDAQFQQKEELLDWLAARAISLPALFGNELKLSLLDTRQIKAKALRS